ncbi:hypothetical protein [Enterovirga aerilata]|uniref:Uncharacterized protein n=1 Tax=Enterovirga aerilata TaxID=2730920 RepID=A0A849I150_9HYPH|nr:hypothetical protein [Enterovirga sp. DB1703]NNM73082.1 hypothetical protein [Enterovirga sp. DB1703]
MQDFVATLLSLFLIQPLQAELTERLEAARVPQAVVAEVAACTRQAAPRVLDRALSDPVWAAGSAIRVWFGAARPEALLVEIAPGCAPAVAAARPFLEGGASS